jgi:hypothetical protein
MAPPRDRVDTDRPAPDVLQDHQAVEGSARSMDVNVSMPGRKGPAAG